MGFLLVDLDRGALELLKVGNPLGDGESLLGAPCSHLDSSLFLGGHGVFDGSLELMEQMGRSGRLDSEPPTRLGYVSNYVRCIERRFTI
jgi:hypothetical protein